MLQAHQQVQATDIQRRQSGTVAARLLRCLMRAAA